MAAFTEAIFSDYTTKLPCEFLLAGSREVAVSEIMYSSVWNNILDGGD